MIELNTMEDVYQAIQMLAACAPDSASLSHDGKEYTISYHSFLTGLDCDVKSASEYYTVALLDKMPVCVCVCHEDEGDCVDISFRDHYMITPDRRLIPFRYDGRFAYKLSKTQFSGESPYKLACMAADDFWWYGTLRHGFRQAGYID